MTKRLFIQWIVIQFIVLMVTVTVAHGAAPDFQKLFVDSTVNTEAHGIWRARGYGWLAEVKEGSLQLFHQNSAGCVQDPTSSLELLMFLEYFSREEAKLLLLPMPGSTMYTFDVVQELPKECLAPADSSPEGVLRFFSATMASHYAFFDLHGVDWEKRVEAASAKVSSTTSDGELFSVLSEMLEGLHDGHLYLRAEIEGEDQVFSPAQANQLRRALDDGFANQSRMQDALKYRRRWLAQYKKNIEKKLLGKSFRSGADDAVSWGRIGDVGYLHIRSMADLAELPLANKEVEAVNKILSKALDELKDVERMIVDVTLNGGGMDEVSLAIAGHFAERRTLSHTKRAKGAEGVAAQEIFVEPATPSFLGPVTLVTSDYTASAAEIFTMAMRALPNVTHIGTPTRGALSDILSKPLPNGWELGLSNEIYLDSEGELWEGRGIPPERVLNVFDSEKDLSNSHWQAILEEASKPQ